jgi:hypothetical protein
MDTLNLKLDSGKTITIKRVLSSEQDFEEALCILDEVMEHEDESLVNQEIVAFLGSLLSAYENRQPSVQNFEMQCASFEYV